MKILALLLLLSSPSFAQWRVVNVSSANAIGAIEENFRRASLWSNRKLDRFSNDTLYGQPVFQNGIKFSDGTIQTTAVVSTQSFIPVTGGTMTGPLVMNTSSITFTNPGAIINPNYIQFNTSWVDGVSEGRLQWNPDDGTLEVGMPGGNVNLQIGQETLLRVRNTSGASIPNGSVVYISSAASLLPTIALADADGNIAQRAPVGLTTENIANNSNGYVTLRGLVHDVNTAGITEGFPIYLSATAGAYSSSIPGLPAKPVPLGVVLRTHATQGIVYIDVIKTPSQISASSFSLTDGGNFYTAFQAGNQDTSIQYTLPTSTSGIFSGGKMLQIDANGNLSWQDPPITGQQAFYFSDTLSNSPYRLMTSSIPDTSRIAASTVVASVSDIIISTYITPVGYPSQRLIPAGEWVIHNHGYVSAVTGAKVVRVYSKIYIYRASSEILIGQTEFSEPLGETIADFEIHLSTGEIVLNVGDRIVVRNFTSVSGAGVNPSVYLYIMNSYFSRIRFPAPAVDITNFVPYAGATGSLNMGGYNITATNYYGNGNTLSNVLTAPATFYIVKTSDYLVAPASFTYQSVGTAVLKAGDTMTGQLTLSGSTLTVTGSSFSVGGSTFVVAGSSVGFGAAPDGTFRYQMIDDMGRGNLLALEKYWNTAQGAYLYFDKSRGVGVSSHSIISANDIIGQMVFRGSNGTSFVNAAAIQVLAETGVGVGNDMPAFMRFYTTPDGSGTIAERMRITSAGLVGINTTTPGSTLHVNGDITGGSITASSVTATGAASFGGNVGIGTTGPGYKLDVQGGDINTSGAYRINGVAVAGLGDAVLGATQTFSGANTFTSNINFNIPATSSVTWSCRTGFTALQSQGVQLGCIQNDEEGSAGWETAGINCFTKYGGKLVPADIILIAFNKLSLSNETDDYEYTANIHSEGTTPRALTYNGSSWVGSNSPPESYSGAYRCWIPTR